MPVGARRMMKHLQSTLETCPLFHNDRVVKMVRLSQQGYCNTHYLVKTQKHRYMMRVFGRDDIDRISEYTLQYAAAQRKITAKPYCLNLHEGYMLTQVLSGVHRTKLSRYELHQLAVVLGKLHTIHRRLKKFNLKKAYLGKERKIRQALSLIQRLSKEYVVCHQDLNPKNVFFSRHARVIDWEYAGINDRYFDLASVCVEFMLTPQEERFFLNRYFRYRKKADYKKLEAYKVVYRAICDVWFEENSLTKGQGEEGCVFSTN